MRIGFLIYVAVFWVVSLGGCSQPEPVVASYAPQDCECEEGVERPVATKSVAAQPVATQAAGVVEAKPAEGVPKAEPERPEVTVSEAVSDSTLARAACAELLRLNSSPKASRKHRKDKSPKSAAKAVPKPAPPKSESQKPAPIAASAPVAPTPTPSDPTRIDLNSATLTQLVGLPGVGPALAGRILDYRQRRRFGKPAHLMRVKGIGKAKYAKIAGLVAVGAE